MVDELIEVDSVVLVDLELIWSCFGWCYFKYFNGYVISFWVMLLDIMLEILDELCLLDSFEVGMIVVMVCLIIWVGLFVLLVWVCYYSDMCLFKEVVVGFNWFIGCQLVVVCVSLLVLMYCLFLVIFSWNLCDYDEFVLLVGQEFEYVISLFVG